jgi:hypothetical protein
MENFTCYFTYFEIVKHFITQNLARLLTSVLPCLFDVDAGAGQDILYFSNCFVSVVGLFSVVRKNLSSFLEQFCACDFPKLYFVLLEKVFLSEQLCCVLFRSQVYFLRELWCVFSEVFLYDFRNLCFVLCEKSFSMLSELYFCPHISSVNFIYFPGLTEINSLVALANWF